MLTERFDVHRVLPDRKEEAAGMDDVPVCRQWIEAVSDPFRSAQSGTTRWQNPGRILRTHRATPPRPAAGIRHNRSGDAKNQRSLTAHDH